MVMHIYCGGGGGGEGTPKLLEGELLKLNSKKSPILKARKNREIIFRGQKKRVGIGVHMYNHGRECTYCNVHGNTIVIHLEHSLYITIQILIKKSF